MQTAIAMPSYILKKENHVAILLLFFFLLLVVLPCLGYMWYNNSNLKDENGILRSNGYVFVRNLSEGLILKNIP